MIACHKMLPVWKDIIILAVLTLLVRLPGLFWGMDFAYGGRPVLFHEDERAFAGHLLEFLNKGTIARQDYVLGFGFLSVWLIKTSFLIFPRAEIFSPFVLVVLVRGMNLFFATATVILLYFFAHLLLRSRLAAFFAALILAFSPLNVVESHYAVPGVSFVFFSYLVFVCALSRQNRSYLWWVAYIASGIAIAI